MTGEVIKSFLVGLGFDVDDSSLAKFNKAIQTATIRVVGLYTAVQAAAAGILYSISKISEGFEEMGYEYHLIAPAINKALTLRYELLKAYAAAGINIRKVIVDSINLNMSLTKTKYAFEAIYKSVGSKFFGLITKQSDLFRAKIYQNMPKIQHVIETLVKFIFKALDATLQLGSRMWSILGRVYDFFVALDKATDGWSTKIIGVIAAWRLLNLSFLATPLGMILTGLVTLLALYDDFKTYQEGGKSFFNWAAAIPMINKIKGIFEDLVDIIGNVYVAFVQLFHADFEGFWESIKAGLKPVIDLFQQLWGIISNIAGGALNWAKDKLGVGGETLTPVQENWRQLKANQANSIASGVANSVAPSLAPNQNVQQQTNINVTGSADANAVGKAVAGEQNRVNFDMTRNLKGATR